MSNLRYENRGMDDKKKKVTIAVPFQQHSFRAAKGLIRHGMLCSYYTSVYNDGKGIYSILKYVLPKDLVIRMQGRNDAEITPYVSKFSQMFGLLYLAACRSSVLKRYTRTIRSVLFKRFGKSAAQNCISNGTEFVLAYDTQAYDLFLNLKKQHSGIVRILDMASTSALTIREIVDGELKKGYPFSDSLKRHDVEYSEEKCNQYLEEMKLADYFLVPSTFVRNSLVKVGIEERRILDLPHGVDVEMFTPSVKKYDTQKTLKFLFVGRVEAAKGIYYILEAFRKLQDLNVELIVVGDMMGQEEALKVYTRNVNFLGLKRRDEMPQYYNEADIFVLSSLWEGSSLSMLEAMASGLPVIASKYSCAPDILTGHEGFVIEPRNIEEIENYIRWYYAHREMIPEMSKAARKLAEKYTWHQYGENLCEIINELA